MSDLKVGLLVGREWSFPPAFIEAVNARNAGVTAEFVKLGGTQMDAPCPYRVIIDRISHEVPYYRTYLKQAALMGATVVNNPFMWTADDKFFEAGLATKLGIASPKTVALPNREYVPGIVHDESLRNLEYPLDWHAVVDYVGLPCVLKDAHGGGWKEVYVCRSLEELIRNYNSSGLLTMVVQEFIEWDHFVRCIALGQREVLPMKYDPRERRYHVEHEHLTPELGSRIVNDSLTLMRALSYDMCSLEWAVKDGVPYAIDFMNPAPDMDINSLTPHYFDWVVKHMADLVIRLAHEAPATPDLSRGEFLLGRREGAARAATSGAASAADVVATVGASAPPSVVELTDGTTALGATTPAPSPATPSTSTAGTPGASDSAWRPAEGAAVSDPVQEAVTMFVEDPPLAGEPGPDSVSNERRKAPRKAAKSPAAPADATKAPRGRKKSD